MDEGVKGGRMRETTLRQNSWKPVTMKMYCVRYPDVLFNTYRVPRKS